MEFLRKETWVYDFEVKVEYEVHFYLRVPKVPKCLFEQATRAVLKAIEFECLREQIESLGLPREVANKVLFFHLNNSQEMVGHVRMLE